MSPNNLTLQNAWSIGVALLPLCLWLMLFLSLQSGDIRDIAHPSSTYGLLQGLRATLPLGAAFLAVVVMAIKMPRQRPGRVLFLGPLGLAAVYGLVGVVAATLSPNGLISLYWSVSYLSVPLVLWAIVWRPNSFDWAGRVISLNWLILIIASASLFAFGLIYLNLGSFLFDPSRWLECNPQLWYDKSSHFIRGTGVGRYAALTAIIALSRLWHPRWRTVWSLILLVSIILLLYSGARTAFIGFSVAAPVVVLLSGGRRAAVVVLVIAVASIPVFWATGIHRDFIDNCILRVVGSPVSSGNQSLQALSSGPEQPDPSILAGAQGSSSSVRDLLALMVPSSSLFSISSNQDIRQNITIEDDVRLTIPGIGRIPSAFFNFSGRTRVWRQALQRFGESPFLGYGFHADRLLLGTHAHNSLVHSLLQTGLIGTIPFVAGLLLAWAMLIKASLNLYRFSADHKPLFIQVAGMLAFLSMRSIYESTGAFFGVDWLLLGPILLYLQILNSGSAGSEVTYERHGSRIG